MSWSHTIDYSGTSGVNRHSFLSAVSVLVSKLRTFQKVQFYASCNVVPEQRGLMQPCKLFAANVSLEPFFLVTSLDRATPSRSFLATG